MENSILKSTKKILGVAPDDDVFDDDILTHINSVFSTLYDLGVGPALGYMIEDDSSTWDEFLGTDPRKNHIRTYMYLRVRLLFDPPQTSYLITALDTQRQELEWRINVQREATAWVDPDPGPVLEDEILDGGQP